MIDSKLLRQNLDDVAKNLARRGYELPVEELKALDEARRVCQVQTQNLQNERNQRSKEIGQAKSRGENVDHIIQSMESVNAQLAKCELELTELQTRLESIYLTIPNLLDDQVPGGKDESNNIVIRQQGTIPKFAFEPKDHVALGELAKSMDFETASKLSGSRFVILKGALSRLHRALAQFMLDVHTSEHGYEECYVPYLVESSCMIGTGQFPKFVEDQFGLGDGVDLWLIPTAEVPLTNMNRDTIANLGDLPIRRTAHSPCFRREAGSYGKDTRGMIRQHQFDKVELVQLVEPSHSEEALEAMTHHAEVILQRLELPYQVILKCAGDTGFTARKTYDLEVWLPSQKCYREISSCSNCGDFQARRLQARYRNRDNKPEFLHTLNGSGVAVGRALVAVLENYQDEGGRIALPTVLKPYFGGASHL